LIRAKHKGEEEEILIKKKKLGVGSSMRRE